MSRVSKLISFFIILVFVAAGSWKFGVINDNKLENQMVIAKGSEYSIAKNVVDFCAGKKSGCIENKLHSLGLNFTDYVSLLQGFLIVFERNESSISCHQLLHEVGREAGVRFAKEGLKGDDLVDINEKVWFECGFGFTHGLVEYLPSSGSSGLDLDKIREICKSTGLGNGSRDACFHGGGHLLWQHWGKEGGLNSCYLLADYDVDSCLAGVWMKEKDVLYTQLWGGSKVKDEELPWIGVDFCDKKFLGGGGECALAYAPLAVALDSSDWVEWCLAKVDPKHSLRCGDNYSYEAINLLWGKSVNNVDSFIVSASEMMKDCKVAGCKEGLQRGLDALPMEAIVRDKAECKLLDNKVCTI